MTKIYESPNGGQTVYQREIGSTTRTLLQDEVEKVGMVGMVGF